MDFREAVVAYRKSPWFRVTYIVVTAFLVANLFTFGAAAASTVCLVFLLIAAIVFLVPYYFGERSIRRFLVNALVMFVLATLMVAALEAQSVLAQAPAPVGGGDGGFAFSEGLVTPYRGAGGEVYTFTVNVTSGSNADPASFSVSANVTRVEGLAISSVPPIQLGPANATDTDTSDGKAYTGSLPLPESIYFYYFSVRDLTTGNVTLSEARVGPINTGFAAFFTFSLYFVIFPMIFPVVLFLLILMLYWWTRTARQRRTGTRVSSEGGPTGFTCTNCGADVPEEASTCPSCGATFEAEPPPSPAGAETEEEPAGEPKDEFT